MRCSPRLRAWAVHGTAHGCAVSGMLSPLYNMGGCAALFVLWAGIDTLEVSYTGQVPNVVRADLSEAKESARSTRHPVVWDFGGDRLGIQATGLKPWTWLACGPDYHLRLGKAAPAASVRLLSLGLASLGPAVLMDRATDALASVGSFGRPRVSRMDVAVDFQGWTPDMAQMSGMVCGATFRPVYPSVDHPETWQYGRGEIVVRLYNKTAECAAKGSHWPAYWEGVDGYKPDEDVWRLEVQVRGEFLRECGLDTPAECLEAAGSVFLAGLAWADLRVPGKAKKKARWRAHPVWESLRECWAFSDPAVRCRDGAAAAGALALLPQVSGLMVLVGAHLGLQSPLEVSEWVLRAMGERDAMQGRDFSARVQDRERDLFGVVTPDGCPPSYALCGL